MLREQTAQRVGLAASGAAFWLVISAFPTAIAIISLFGLVVSPERVASDLGNLANGAPASLGAIITGQLRHVAASSSSGLSLGFAISLLLAIWSASAGVYNLDRAIRVAYGLAPQSYVQARGRALVAAFVVVLALGVGALGLPVLLAHLPAGLVFAVGVPVVLAAATAAVALLYRFAAGKGVGSKRQLPGAVASSLGLLVVFVGFGAYVNWSTHYTAVFGVFAGAVVGMIGTYLAVYAVLLGAVLNMELSRAAAVE